MLADAIAKCRNKFDTQYVVRILMQDNPIEYVQHLNAAGVKDPIRHGTTLISKMLSENMVALRIKKAIRDKRPDVRVLKKTDNQAWEKQ